MKLNGITEQDHKIGYELERNNSMMKEIAEVEDIEKHMEPHKKLKVDGAALQRHIKHHMQGGEKIENEGALSNVVKKLQTSEESVRKDVRVLNKGSILPRREHLNWKEHLEKLTK